MRANRVVEVGHLDVVRKPIANNTFLRDRGPSKFTPLQVAGSQLCGELHVLFPFFFDLFLGFCNLRLQ